ncbi:MAG: PAAR-like domain-containing protein, partial [Pseudomonadota bacterium]
MPSSVTVDKMTTQHKMSMGITNAFPDVCKTPAPPAPSPVPIPYPNIANSIMAALGVTKRVKDNKQCVMVKGASYTLSNGDQAGVALGIKSNKIMGKSSIKNQSFFVKFEKKGVGRLKDPHGINCGSNFNGLCIAEGQPPMMGMGTKAQKAACDRLKKNQVDPDKRDEAAR